MDKTKLESSLENIAKLFQRVSVKALENPLDTATNDDNLFLMKEIFLLRLPFGLFLAHARVKNCEM